MYTLIVVGLLVVSLLGLAGVLLAGERRAASAPPAPHEQPHPAMAPPPQQRERASQQQIAVPMGDPADEQATTVIPAPVPETRLDVPTMPPLMLQCDRPQRRVRFTEGPITTGRNPGCGLLLEEPGVSRQHAIMRWTRRGWTVEDCQSSNGTYVNGNRIREPYLVRSGDVIAFGWKGPQFRVTVGQ